jgi:hypothetical protein
VTKARVASKDAESGKPPADQVTTGEYPAVGDEEEETEDVFKEIPTVANRANPTAVAPAGDSAAQPGPPEGAGAYRILHPATSDVVETPATARAEAAPAKRMVLSPARKPK